MFSIRTFRLHPRRSVEYNTVCKILVTYHQRSSRKSDGFQTIEKVDVNPRVILLAEDDVQVQYFIWKLLKADGFTVLTAGNGAFALEASRNYPGPVDLLVTDLEMPRMSGLELCEKIRAERPGIKVLVMSGNLRTREHDSVNGLPFLQKPFTPTALRESIEALLCPIPSLS